MDRTRGCLLLAHFGHSAMSDLSPLCAPKRTSADHSKFMGSRHSHQSKPVASAVPLPASVVVRQAKGWGSAAPCNRNSVWTALGFGALRVQVLGSVLGREAEFEICADALT